MPYNTEQALLSSPDPLNDTPTFSSPAKPHTTGVHRSLPLQGGSPRKQTFELDVGNQLSPQKIRVTVEAEHSDKENSYTSYGGKGFPSPTPYRAPAVRRNVRTTTTTVPVKGLSDSEDDTVDNPVRTPKRGRGRPRKSTGTPIPSKSRTRTVTPGAKSSRRRRRTLGDLVDGDDEEDWDFAIGAGVEVSRGKGRSRSRSLKEATRNKATPAEKPTSLPGNMGSSTTSRKGRGRRKTLTPEDVLILEDEIETFSNDRLEHDTRGLEDAEGVLAPRHVNLVPTPSAFSTIRSTTTVGSDNSDVLLAKFSPAKRTPTKTGWSSPRIIPFIKTQILSSSHGRAEEIPPPALSLEASCSGNVGDGKEGNDEGCHDKQKYGEEAEDGVGELQEFDTILESEGFSMISVESVPSLREHLSSPVRSNQSSEKKSTAVSRTVMYLKDTNNAVPEDSFSSIAPEILEAATPGRRAPKPCSPLGISAHNAGDRDSSLSAPREILEPTTSGAILQERSLLSAKAIECKGNESSFSSIAPEVLERVAPGRRVSNNLLLVKSQERRVDDDSFSSIPSTILEAVSPEKPCQMGAGYTTTQSRAEGDSMGMKSLLVPSINRPQLDKQNRANSRLLTPDDTPSPPTEAAQQHPTANHIRSNSATEPESNKTQEVEGSSMMSSQMKSSPPSVPPRRFTYTAHLRQYRSLHPDITQTPSIVFSSPCLPSLIQQIPLNRGQESVGRDAHEPPRQSLSPIMRSGQVLQDIALPPSSKDCTQSLGSPFKSPIAHRNSGGSPVDILGSHGPRKNAQKSFENNKGIDGDVFGGFSDDTRRELRKSLVMGEELSRGRQTSAETTKWSSVDQQEDPFTSAAPQPRLLSPEERKRYNLELPSQQRVERVARPEVDTVRGESAMSWEAHNAVPVHTSSIDADRPANGLNACISKDQSAFQVDAGIIETTELWEKRREAEWARERAAVSSQIESASTSQVIVISSDDNEYSAGSHYDVGEEEEDIWQAEARHSSSLVDEHPQKEPIKQELVDKPRRSKIPSPWRKNSKRLVYSDELTQSFLSPPVEKPKIVPSKRPTRLEPAPAQITVRKRLLVQDVAEEESLDSSIAWHIPQKSNFTPRPRNSGNLDLSALLASSPTKVSPTGSHLFSKSRIPLFGTSASNTSTSAHTRLHAFSSSTVNRTPSYPVLEHLTNEAPLSTESESSVNSASTSYESDQESEMASDPSQTEHSIRYPCIAPPTSPSPQKSCLRTPTSISPAKSVTFVSPTPSPPPLSSTTWSKAHWKLLDAIYQDSKLLPLAGSSPNGENGNRAHREAEQSQYLGKKISARGTSLVLQKWHLDIVKEFREEVPGWDEGVVAKRLFALIVGEQERRQEAKMQKSCIRDSSQSEK